MFGVCNYCLVSEIRSRALRAKKFVTLVKNTQNKQYPLSMDIYVSPPEITEPQKFGKQYHALWIAALPAACRC